MHPAPSPIESPAAAAGSQVTARETCNPLTVAAAAGHGAQPPPRTPSGVTKAGSVRRSSEEELREVPLLGAGTEGLQDGSFRYDPDEATLIDDGQTPDTPVEHQKPVPEEFMPRR